MIENLFEFVNQPGPTDYLVQCRLTRHKGGLDGGHLHLHVHHRRHCHLHVIAIIIIGITIICK